MPQRLSERKLCLDHRQVRNRRRSGRAAACVLSLLGAILAPERVMAQSLTDACTAAASNSDASVAIPFDTIGATTDGPTPEACEFGASPFGRDLVDQLHTTVRRPRYRESL